MKDFRLRNDTVLLFRDEPVNDIMGFAAGKKVLFVYGGASVHHNGCYDDVKNAVSAGLQQVPVYLRMNCMTY